MTRKAMRPATPAVMGRNLAVPRGNRRRSQGNDSNDERPAGCRSPVGERGSNTDFTGWPSTEGQTGSQHALEGRRCRSKSNWRLSQSRTQRLLDGYRQRMRLSAPA
ncbi:hypothetical protein CJT67_09225 [Pseudomonas aeruginosa]|nr:hypothetical protein CJT66_05360 [Pseudomonas aeruginosa]PCB86720.1 hypothetical protein CJT67_09225 [Pseudomonas aeruginosa]